MKFSVIIATCDRPELLAKAIAAVQVALARVEGGEIIVVDNGVKSADSGQWTVDGSQRSEAGSKCLSRSAQRAQREEATQVFPRTVNSGRVAAGGDPEGFSDQNWQLNNSDHNRESLRSQRALREVSFSLCVMPSAMPRTELCSGAGAPCVRILRSELRNKAKALNVGIAAAQYEWLAFTDDDCLPDPGWLVEAQKYVTSFKLQVFGGRVIPGPLPEGAPCWLKPGKSGRVPKGPAIVDYSPLPASGILDNKMQVPLGANFFAHKSVFAEYGGYDEDLWRRCRQSALGCEDAELGIRLRGRGERVGYCSDAMVVHPILSYRTTLKHHLKWAYRCGARERYFADPASGLEISMLGFIFGGVLRAGVHTICRNQADAVINLMSSVNVTGRMLNCRR